MKYLEIFTGTAKVLGSEFGAAIAAPEDPGQNTGEGPHGSKKGIGSCLEINL